MTRDDASSEASNSRETGSTSISTVASTNSIRRGRTTASPRQTLPDAYCRAWDILKVIFARFRTPFQLFALGAVRQWRMYECLDWLRPVELMLRCMIFIEAQALAKDLPEPQPLRTKRPHKPCCQLDLAFDTANSPAWRISFANLRPARPGRPSRTYKPQPARAAWEARCSSRASMVGMLNPLPLACRLDAIIRVCTDLWPRIARLAARMKRGLVPLIATRTRPQPIRTPRTLPTLNRLGALMGLPILRRCGSS